jgi:hypothetical protein
MFFPWARSTETRFEPPMSMLPETTEGTTVAPPWPGLTLTVSFRFLKKPFSTPYSRKADGTPAVSSTRTVAGFPDSPPLPPSSPHAANKRAAKRARVAVADRM